MKKKFIFITAVILLVSVTSLLPALARKTETITDDMSNIEVIWSGTWQIEGMEGENNPGTNCFDGDFSNKWGSNDLWTKTEAEWVGVKFKSETEISGWSISQEASGNYTNIKQYSVQIQKGTDEWVTVYTSEVLDDFWLDDSVDLEQSVKATAWRFYVTREQAAQGHISPAGECAIELSEIELYRTIETAETEPPATGGEPKTESTKTPDPSSSKAPTASKSATKAPENDTKDNTTTLIIVISVIAVVVVAGVITVIILKKKKK